MKKYNLPKDFTVTAHTGCMNTPANTIESIAAGFSSGADIIEIDVRFISDGTPVLSHNSIPESEESNAVRLAEAFDCIKKYPDKKVNIDIKETSNIAAVQSLAKEKGVIDQVFFTGIWPKFVHSVKKYCPEVSFYLNYALIPFLHENPLYIKMLINKVKRIGAMGLNINKRFACKRLVSECRKNGLLISLWTITDTNSANKYLSLSPDNITCKNPDEVMKLLGRN